MKKFRIVSVLLIVTMIAVLTGCGGGGGSSAPVEKDVTGISSTLNNYMAALRANDSAAAARHLSSTPASPTSSGDAVRTLIVQDFGSSITDNKDNQSWDFHFFPQDIIQPSNEIAFVTARCTLHSGEVLTIRFSMIKEGGVWFIADMALLSPTGTLIDTIPVTPIDTVPVTPIDTTPVTPLDPTPVTPSAFVTQTFFPLDHGIYRIYALEGGDGTANTETRTVSGYSSGSLENGITFHQMIENFSNHGASDFEGASSSPVTTNRRKIRAATYGTNGDYGDYGNYGMPLFESASSIYFGFDSSGNLWAKTPEANNGAPFMLLKSSYAYGSTDQIEVSWNNDGSVYDGKITIEIGSPAVFNTSLRAYTAVPLKFLTSIGSTAVNKWVLYLAAGVGKVGEDNFQSAIDTTAAYVERMLTRYSSDNTLNERNDPVITTSANLGSYYYGQTITTINLSSSGGTAPYNYYVHSGSLLEGVSLSPAGVIAGSITGTPPLGDFPTTIKVYDKYGRFSTKVFNMTIVAASGDGSAAAVTFSPALSSVSEGGSLEAYVLINGTSVNFSDYTASAIDVAPTAASSYITFYQESGFLKISIYGYTPNNGQIQFTAHVRKNSDSTTYNSNVQTVSIVQGTAGF